MVKKSEKAETLAVKTSMRGKKSPVAKRSTTKKNSAVKDVKAKKVAAKKRFPAAKLNSFLRKNSSWDHEQWEALLGELTKSGYGEFTSTQEGRNRIGLYLESKRNSFCF